MEISIILSIIFCILFQLAYGESLEIQLGKNITGTIDESKETKYYKIIMGLNTDNSDLVINVFPKDEMENFCDPDLYVSKVLK